MPNPLAGGHAKKNDCGTQATAVLQGSALTKIAGGHFGEPPLWAIRCLFTVSPRAVGDTGQVIKSRKEPLAKA